jgi:hypothetical protein
VVAYRWRTQRRVPSAKETKKWPITESERVEEWLAVGTADASAFVLDD